MRIRLICCDVFARLAYAEAAVSPHTIDIELLPMLAHNEPAQLRANLQEAINSCAKEDCYNLIVLGYGLCGNAVSGITSPIPLIIPRMHDCCAMFMGSRSRFLEVFGHRLSTRWRSAGYMERSRNLPGLDYKTLPEYLKTAEEYGEENAEYVWQTLHPPAESNEAVYIKTEDDSKVGSLCRQYHQQYIEEMDKIAVQVVNGDTGWFRRMINGPWEEEDFFKLYPGYEIMPIYDMNEILSGKEVFDENPGQK